MPKFIDCEQRSPEWFRIRAGRLTASHMAELFAYSKQKGKEGIELKARSDYRMALLSERLTGQVARHFVTEEMKWGQEQEEYARTIYELKNSVFVEQIGFAIHPTMDFAGASPDGLVGEDGADLRPVEQHVDHRRHRCSDSVNRCETPTCAALRGICAWPRAASATSAARSMAEFWQLR